MSTRPRKPTTIHGRSTPNDARALTELDAERGPSIQGLADRWGCDASNVTLIVNRLERLGLAERRAVPEDRRVRHVVLTALGVEKRAELQDRMYEPPVEVARLDRGALTALLKALEPLRHDRG